ncbi:serine/threonine-protein kinase [Spirillospora sp. NPDC029432]|uniref:serine/threonine-protein kinase n=1 Tax=Spirillospora sp. NPDC029432 TaxID=3154599 RepID=UPI003452880D
MPEQLVLAGRYRLLERLGSGGMGTVWAATDETLRREVAVKEIVFPEELSAEQRRVAVERAQREARAAALIDHPSVITVHDVVVEDDRPWLVMELVRGVSLEQLVRRHGPRPPAMAARVGLQVLDALQAVHAKGIVHRDVKPSNVLLADDGQRVVLADFGIASVDSDPSLTKSGTFVGSPGYVAPERLRERPVGPESDLWSLGATLYMAVEGRGPFERESHMASLGAVLTQEPDPPRQAGSLAPLLWYLLQKEPAARLPVDAVRQVLRNVADGKPSGLRDPVPPPMAAVPAGPPPSPPGRGSRLWIPVASGAAVLVLAAATIGAAVAMSGDDGPDASEPPPKPESAAPAPPPSSASPSAAAVDLCGLLTDGQIGRLFPAGTPERGREEGESCFWTTSKHGLSVDDESSIGSAEPPDSESAAHNRFVSMRNARTRASDDVYWGWTEIGVRHVRASQSAARTVTGIGDEAFAYTATGMTEPMDKAYVVFRAGKVVLSVMYAYERGASSPEKASQAARWMARNLAGRA